MATLVTSAHLAREQEPVFNSSGVAPDGRPLMEVTLVTVEGKRIALRGTACVYEGNVLVRVDSGQDLSVQASAGGPARGDWVAAFDVPVHPVEVSIGGEDAERGGLLQRSTVGLRIAADGSVTRLPS